MSGANEASEAKAPGDHFSTVSAGYAAFRPTYPHALLEFVASIAPRRHLAWDCGAGTGQATIALAEFFDVIVGTDVSAKQIEQAPAHEKIRWLVAPAESTPLDAGSVDLITVAQALHWFDHARFNDEVRRVAAPGAAIAAWSYAAPKMDGAIGDALTHFMYGTLNDYWPAERRYVDEEYRTIPFPFARIETPVLSLEDRWTRAQLAGYARTWSATTRYLDKNGIDPVVELERALAEAWPMAGDARRIEWPLILLAGRVS